MMALWWLTLYPKTRRVMFHLILIFLGFLFYLVMKDLHDPTGLTPYWVQRNHMISMTEFIRFLSLQTMLVFHLMDSKDRAIKPLMGYIGKERYLFSKTVIDSFLMIYGLLVLMFFLQVLMVVMTGFFYFSWSSAVDFLLDGLICMVLYLVFYHQNHTFSLLLVTTGLWVLALIVSDFNLHELYYVLPLSHLNPKEHQLDGLYRLWYVATGIWVYAIKSWLAKISI